MLNKLSVSEKWSLIEWIRKDEVLAAKFDLSDIEERIKNVTPAEKSYIIALMINKKRFDLNNKMIQLGFKPKI